MTSGVGIVDGKTGMNLADGVGLGLTLAINSEASIPLGDIVGEANIVGVSGGVGVVDGKAGINLADDVGLGLSLTLAVDSIVDARVGVAVDSTIVTNSTVDSV